MPKGDNWTKEEDSDYLTQRSSKLLADVKEWRSKREYVRILISTRPLVVKEIDKVKYDRLEKEGKLYKLYER